MDVPREEIDKRMAILKEGLKKAGVKVTHQRLEVFREVAKSEKHPDAERIFEGVRQRVPTISLDTVYRTLWLLIDLGLVNPLGPPRDSMRFDANLKPHHHFVCIKCGLTLDFYCEECDRLQLPDTVQTMGTVEIKQVEVKGICHKCSQDSNNKNRARREKEEK